MGFRARIAGAWSGGVVAAPAFHGSGADELFCLVLPLALIAAIVLAVMVFGPRTEALDAGEAEPGEQTAQEEKRRSAEPQEL